MKLLLLDQNAQDYELIQDLCYRRQQLKSRIRAVVYRLSNDLQRVRNVLIGGDNLDTVVLVIACNRSEALKEHLETLMNLQGPKIPVVVSLDCNDERTRDVVITAGQNITMIENPDQSSFNLTKQNKKYEGYYRIARHYRFALDYVFTVLGYRTVIVTEDDLMLAPDFLEYMVAAKKLLFEDPTVWCISAWNDNGKEQLIVNNNSLLHRTDFFPGDLMH
ncbi:unnamed protein product [Thelazia callipaeda]|uniref:Alpha-1,3-mannosyl-glycoprotein 2-beta-N-acetylglucosaminyltransferase n=1 Tax=Thelazia callipaeda TaxID=103827 RepID=A0A158RB01_THECL|nr:unnamed protein product [Thelazia callipaeda]